MQELIKYWNEYIDELVSNLKPIEEWLKEGTPEEARQRIANIKGSFVGFMEWLVKKV